MTTFAYAGNVVFLLHIVVWRFDLHLHHKNLNFDSIYSWFFNKMLMWPCHLWCVDVSLEWAEVSHLYRQHCIVIRNQTIDPILFYCWRIWSRGYSILRCLVFLGGKEVLDFEPVDWDEVWAARGSFYKYLLEIRDVYIVV